MERTVLCWIPILVTVVAVGAAPAASSIPTTPTASPLAAFLPTAGRLPVTSSAHATPSVKGKVFVRYVARLTPPRSNGKVVGDRGATGKVIMKGVKASASASYLVLKMRIKNIRSGGAAPYTSAVTNCLAGQFVEGYEGIGWENITRTSGGRPKRYSFATSTVIGPGSQADIRAYILSYTHQSSGQHLVVSHPENDHALCGKLKKRPVKARPFRVHVRTL